MTKKHLFSILSFLFAIAWLYIFEVKEPLRFAIFGLLIEAVLGLAYEYCKEDSKND
jgi:hypothetical protein